MTDTTANAPDDAPVEKRKRRVKAAPKPKPPSPFAGITASACPSACTPECCVISTIDVCKHPYKSAINGCGPVTLANREKALKIIKRQKIDAAA